MTTIQDHGFDFFVPEAKEEVPFLLISFHRRNQSTSDRVMASLNGVWDFLIDIPRPKGYLEKSLAQAEVNLPREMANLPLIVYVNPEHPVSPHATTT